MKTTNINVRASIELKQELIKLAESKGKDLSSFLLEEIYLHLRDYFVKCPNCQKPCFDERDMPLTGKATVKCQYCNHGFEHDFE